MKKTFFASMPKSGTHLFEQAVDRDKVNIPSSWPLGRQVRKILNHRNSSFVGGHILPRGCVINAIQDRVIVFVYRETTQDMLCSYCHFYNRPKKYLASPQYEHMLGEEWVEAEDRLLWVIENIKPFYDEMMQWKLIADYVLTYEEMVERPEKAFASLRDVFHRSLDSMVAKSKYRGGKHYRRGVIGGWRDDFEPHHVEAYERIWG